MTKAYFISETYIKENSLVDENVDMKIMKSIIWDAQFDYMLPILGTDLYNKIISDINGSTLTGDYLTLVNDYVAPALVKWVMYELVPSMSYKYRNKSVSKQRGDNSDFIDYKEVSKEQDRWRSKAESRSQRITKYLCVNSDLFPEYTSNDSFDDVQPNRNNYTSGIFLG